MSGNAPSGVALQAVRRAVLDQAAAEAESLRVAARARANEVLTVAGAEADLIVARRRDAADRLAEAEQRGRLAEARAEAGAGLLAARRTVLTEARAAARTAATALLDDPRYRQLLERLEADARRRLGDKGSVRTVALADGGFIAQAGARQIDCSLDSLLDRCLESLGPELERLWR